MQATTQHELRELDADLLARTYDELLVPSFPAEELLTFADLQELYLIPDEPEPSVVVLRDDEPVAVMLGEWFADRRVLLLAYVAVAPNNRRGGVGAQLVGEVLRGWADARPGAVVLAEVEDPRWHREDPVKGDPVARLRFYGRLGARLLPLPYTQPSLRPGLGRVPGLLLLRLDHGGPAPPGLLRTFLTEYFVGCEGPGAVAEPAVDALLREVDDAGTRTDLPSPVDYSQLPGPPGPEPGTFARRT